MNINRVYIKNFKNYSGEHTFDLSKRLTIIVGRNGFGKSSFFDAIEWCLTGQINRFNKKEFNPKDVLNFEDYGMNKECKVIIFFNGHKLERSFKLHNEKLGNIKVTLIQQDGTVLNGQTNIDDFLKNNYFRSSNENNALFGDLLKHSHLLSQDQISDFVSKDSPRDRFNSLAEILGLKNVLYTFENLTQVKKSNNKRIDKLIEQKEKNIIQRKERRKDLATVDHKLIFSYLNELNVKGEFRESFNSLEKLKRLQEENLYNNKRQRQVFQRFLDNGYLSVDEIKNKLQELKGDITKVHNDNKAKTMLKDRVQTLYRTLQEHSHKFEELNELNNQIKITKALINQTQYKVLSNEEVKDLLGVENQELSKIEYSLSYQRSYNEKKEFLGNFPIQIEELNKKMGFYSRRTERLNKLLEKMDERINQRENGITVRLLEHLKGILKFVEENSADITGKCPVCSVEHGKKLPELINANIKQNDTTLKEDTIFAEKNLALKNRIIGKKELVLSKREDINNQIHNLRTREKNSKDQLEKIITNSLFSLEYIENSSSEELGVLKQESIKNISKLNEFLSNKIDYEKLINKQAILKKVIGTSHSSQNTNNRQNRLKRAEERIRKNIENNEAVKVNLESEYNSLFKEYSEIEQKEEYQTLINEIEILNKEENDTGKKLDKISYLLEIKQSFDFNKKIGKDIRKYYLEFKVLNKQIERLNEISDSIDSFLNNMQLTIGNKTTTFLNTENSLIQKFYRYLNPMSNNKGVQFEVENGELNIFLPIKDGKDRDVLFNVKHTLSSGQLNVLAISIFLAINESQKVSKLDFIGIDDPIQNMDDVNRFSICDVLSVLENQVIISTHDMEFVKLLVKKNQHASEQIQVYILESPLLEADRVKRVTFN